MNDQIDLRVKETFLAWSDFFEDGIHLDGEGIEVVKSSLKFMTRSEIGDIIVRLEKFSSKIDELVIIHDSGGFQSFISSKILLDMIKSFSRISEICLDEFQIRLN